MEFILLIFLTILAILTRYKDKKLIICGTTPIISYAYWSNALKALNLDCITLMSDVYLINERSDFDFFYKDLTPQFLRSSCWISGIFAFLFILKNAKMLITSYDSIFFKGYFARFEMILLKISGVKVVICPYGADAYMYSRVKDLSLQNALLISYPKAAKREDEIQKTVYFKNKYADGVIVGFQNEGLNRWDVLCQQPCVININLWTAKTNYSIADGINNEVIIAHAPNHRGFKGTEFILQALNELIDEGYKIKIVVLEKIPNSEVRTLLGAVDILVEQIIATAYALNGIEGMALGLPVLSNLESVALTQVFRRYSFLNECPILSTTPENIKDNLRLLITNPKLREELGRAGRQYVEKYHSYKTAQYMFGAIYDKIVLGKEVDLMNLFHPLFSKYNQSMPHIQHPLINNKLPTTYLMSQ